MNMARLKRLSLVLLVALFGSVGLVTQHAWAADTPTDSQLVQIRTRCNEIQATLSRVHANDALVRVNRGQLYERLSTKLAVPLNSRIALNRLDGSSLLSVMSRYDVHLNEFRVLYQSYEEQLSNTMRTNCVNQPAKFYESLESARMKRQAVRESTQRLNADIADYKQAFTEFASSYRGENQ
jgi:hypothetical protein